MITAYFNKIFVDTNIALGNHLFQYVLCRLIATKNNYNFFMPHESYLTKCFKNLDMGVKDGNIRHTFREDASKQTYNPNLFNIQDFTNLHGYFQTDKYYEGSEELIKSWFEVDIDDNCKEIINNYPIDNVCYIHIRGGDYKDAGWMLPKKYFEGAMDEVRKLKSDISFVIITDDVEVSKQMFPHIDVLSKDVATDFKLLYNSKYSIISNSTFSWWSSWLSDKEITVAPNNWLNYNEPNKGFYPLDIRTNKFIYI
jgi:hypothetical protein